MKSPLAILISDIHFTVPTLELASAALQQALDKAEELNVPLVIAGDLLDSKAIVRAECANRIIEILSGCEVSVYVLVGNHDLINEKSKEHSLNFLRPYCHIVDEPEYCRELMAMLIPYTSDPEELKRELSSISTQVSTVICHQGVQTADMGHYIQDRTSLLPEDFGNFRVISGHYHKAQDIKCGPPRRGAVGLFSYIGNPYTLGFGEANDGPKAYRILYVDGTLESVPTNLRKHIIIDMSTDGHQSAAQINPGDAVLVRLRGPRSKLAGVSRKHQLFSFLADSNFKLELIPIDETTATVQTKSKPTSSELLDSMIDGLNDDNNHKTYLKRLWRDLLNENT